MYVVVWVTLGHEALPARAEEQLAEVEVGHIVDVDFILKMKLSVPD